MPKIAKSTFQLHLFKVYYLHILGIRILMPTQVKEMQALRDTKWRESKTLQTSTEQQALIKQLNVIDDVFFQKIAEDKDVC